MKVLLVDDEIEFVSALAERIMLRDIEVEWTAKPEEAIERTKNDCFDIAILDIKMPRVGGFDLKKRLEKQCPEMKFIFLTGHGSEEAFQTGTTETGSEFYLVKPVRFETLLEKIRAIGTTCTGGKNHG
ncbi:MAG: response regulator [Desulfobacterales bacterium]|nr:response regulator [Desulfobacterales bacterium]MCF8078689.1 response regulator [Desulfobacterales bacterium]